MGVERNLFLKKVIEVRTTESGFCFFNLCFFTAIDYFNSRIIVFIRCKYQYLENICFI